LLIFSLEFSFRLQNIKSKSSFEIQNNNPKSFTFYKSSPSSNPNGNSPLLRSSDLSGNNKGKLILEDLNIDKKMLDSENFDLLKLQKCEGGSEFVREENDGFWRKITGIVSCGCFNVKK